MATYPALTHQQRVELGTLEVQYQELAKQPGASEHQLGSLANQLRDMYDALGVDDWHRVC